MLLFYLMQILIWLFQNYDIKQKIEELTNSVNVDLSDVIIFSNYTRDELNKLKDAALNAINFTSYQKQVCWC